LLAVVVIGLPGARAANFTPFAPTGVVGILQATGLLFFAYTGYSRIATLVEEVRNPKRTIPRATVIALGTATLLYLFVAATALGVLGAARLSQSLSPLEGTLAAVGSGVGVIIVAAGALLTTFNEGLSDLLGVSRVAFAMGREADLPQSLAHLGRGQNPWRSVVFVGVIAMLVAAFAPFGVAVAVSSFGTLLYYTVTNMSALKLPRQQRTFPRWLAMAGLIGCLGLALGLVPQDIGIGLAILLVGIIIRGLRLAVMRGIKHTWESEVCVERVAFESASGALPWTFGAVGAVVRTQYLRLSQWARITRTTRKKQETDKNQSNEEQNS
jgi:APA family basic amino acid/polyamine antiporter